MFRVPDFSVKMGGIPNKIYPVDDLKSRCHEHWGVHSRRCSKTPLISTMFSARD